MCIHELFVNIKTDIEPLNEPLLSFEDLKDFYEPSSKIVNVTGINFTIHGTPGLYSFTQFATRTNPPSLHRRFLQPPLLGKLRP